jgi:gamma-glutamylaminecyclotransferase
MCSDQAITLCASGVESGSECLLFVYGTLRRGYENHEAYLQDAQFLGRAVTQNKFALFLDDFPYLNKTPAVSSIAGEIYRVDERTLARIDCLEGHPDEYRRELITVVTEQGMEYAAWTYFYPEPSGKLIESGDYADRVKP